MGPQDPNDVSRDIARDLTGIAGELAALKGDAAHWLTSSEYDALKHRLEDAHAAVEAAPVRLAAFRTPINSAGSSSVASRNRLSHTSG